MATTPREVPQLTVGFAMLVLVALGAFTAGALLNSAAYAFLVLAVATPVLVLVLTRNARKRPSQ